MRRVLIVLAVLVAAALAAWGLWGPPGFAAEIDRETLDRLVETAGLAGPVVIVALMIVAVVASPVPSAPIAMASGAAYGHFWGSLWVIIGAEIGALIAFGLARGLGQGAMRRWFGERIEQGLLGSQNTLTALVFASRLMPFVSFDLISYAAGLSALKFWRFALATLAGIAPASFLLAHFGTTAASGNASILTWSAALGLGVVTGAPLVWAAWRGRKSRFR
ncbi:TVP38/TMEM64 family protein [Loktanella sp. SALINAS62]|uniref:TVP38/TMEM64 family protein n=1 Tax=Loktanella sp. SALINAS62 TaxID=2706124 RepID=UPI001B8BD0CB|nr:TVP38/TMEM64 family protein [Loktanella sp. SALINAS62]MBS1303451.1 TVP38/TMEM64 family protein [Loktanella sp. SALINAS62]